MPDQEEKLSNPLEIPVENPGVRRSIFRNLMISMVGFGVFIGIIFPPFARIVLDTPRALSIQFFAMCIFAGFIVGLVNNLIFSRIVSYEINQIVLNMNKVLDDLLMVGSRTKEQSLHLEVTSSDAIGKIQISFNQMIDTVTIRTRALETSSQVSRRLSTILNQHDLLKAVVEEVQGAFNFYHAQIYLFDDSREKLVMMGGTGEAGRLMLEQRHRIELGKGLVGRAALSNEVILVPDTARDPNWLPNRLLSETKSEVAVPISVADRVLGVLDVQQNKLNGITSSESDLLRSIANQIAVAVQNAQLYTRAQRQVERETLINTITEKIQSAMTIEDVLQVAARELGIALNANCTSVKIENINIQ